MIKVLLVFGDFNELTITESYLKKIGIDVAGITNEVLLQDQVLSFRPDIVVTSGKSNRVNSLSVGQKLKENYKFAGKVVIVVAKDQRPSSQDILKIKMDAMLESPFQADKLVQVLARLGGLNAEAYLDKLHKSRFSEEEKKVIHVTGAVQFKGPENSGTKDLLHDPQRIKKYQKFINDEEIDFKKSSHQKSEVKKAQEELKKSWDFEQLEKQDELKRRFAEALFKKNK